MKILGISANHYHDASAALVINGVPIASSSEDRFSLQKHDPNYPALAIDFCLKTAGINAKELDYVAFHEIPEVKFTRALSAAYQAFPFSAGFFTRSMREAMSSGFWLRAKICDRLGVYPEQVLFTPHHLSHAAHAFLTSPYDEAVVLTVDGVGEWMSGGIFACRRAGKTPFRPLHMISFPHSLGIVYAAFTGYLGFKVNDSECSTMALAAFGRPHFLDQVRQIIRQHPDGTYEVDLSYFSFTKSNELPVTSKFLSLFGAPRPFRSELPFSSFGAPSKEFSDDDIRFADIACSIQMVIEEELVRLAQKAREISGLNRLCFSGGVALNCVANSKLLNSGVFNDVFIPVDPGDGGGALGAALYTSLLKSPEKHAVPRIQGPYLGEKIDTKLMLNVIEGLDKSDWKVTTPRSEQELLGYCAKLLSEGRIMGWAHDRAENGPRALGNRSILIRADDLDLARRLSDKVKRRAYFRPYACSMTAQESKKIFGSAFPVEQNPFRWMQSSVEVPTEQRSKIRAAIHIDGTTRPQVCTSSDNPKFHGLLVAYGEISGSEVLLNTSFNPSGFPIVNNALDALMMFYRSTLDALVVNDVVIERKP